MPRACREEMDNPNPFDDEDACCQLPASSEIPQGGRGERVVDGQRGLAAGALGILCSYLERLRLHSTTDGMTGLPCVDNRPIS